MFVSLQGGNYMVIHIYFWQYTHYIIKKIQEHLRVSFSIC